MFQDYIQEENAVQSHGRSHCSYLLPFSKTLLTHCQPVVEIVGCSWLRSINYFTSVTYEVVFDYCISCFKYNSSTCF